MLAANYRLAMRYVNEACRLRLNDGRLINTVGVAHYRLGEYQEALVTLHRSDKMNQPAQHGPYPMDVAFRAMAEYRLGRLDDAQADLKLLRQRMTRDPWAHKEDFLACVQEAEALLARPK